MTDDQSPRLYWPIRDYIDREVERAVERAKDADQHEREISDMRFATIEQARSIAKVEADLRLGDMVKVRNDMIEEVRQLVRNEQLQVGSAAGRASMREIFLPNAPALISLLVAIAALAVVVLK